MRRRRARRRSKPAAADNRLGRNADRSVAAATGRCGPRAEGGGIKFDKFDFGPSNIVVTLHSGKLVADLKQTSLFGGAGGASFVADGSGAKPAIALKANLDGLR